MDIINTYLCTNLSSTLICSMNINNYPSSTLIHVPIYHQHSFTLRTSTITFVPTYHPVITHPSILFIHTVYPHLPSTSPTIYYATIAIICATPCADVVIVMKGVKDGMLLEVVRHSTILSHTVEGTSKKYSDFLSDVEPMSLPLLVLVYFIVDETQKSSQYYQHYLQIHQLSTY